jgi:hypothetical protein
LPITYYLVPITHFPVPITCIFDLSMPGFRQLNVWQRSKKLAVEIYRLTQTERFSRDFGLRDQIRRAAVSIPSNVAEGDERGTNREAIRFFVSV